MAPVSRKPAQEPPKPEQQPPAQPPPLPAVVAEASTSASPSHAKAQGLPRMKPPAPLSKAEQKAREKDAAHGKLKSKSGRQSRASSVASQVPRVFPTQIVLKSDTGEELWRSSELFLSENMRAAELLSRDSSQRFNMPQEFADAIQADTHELFVFDSVSGDYLQIANLASTNLQSLQRHAGNDGKLTMVISPLEDSEDAFETMG
mmetsp:Transcript_95490/g.275715  ORF Transcript_95490/g.275715 Transcript_95490/m.275715 type:complete len:204 (-) Transcript_95490:47-658(-)